MFITTKRHRQILDAERDAAHDKLDAALVESRLKGRLASQLLGERDAARAELSALKASRARSNANLRPGNVRRKLAAPAT